MPSREEQFDQWLADATRNDLLDAVTDKKKASLEESFLESQDYERARDEFIIDELEGESIEEYFKEDVWYDESADTTDEDEEEASEEADDEAKEDGDLGEGD